MGQLVRDADLVIDNGESESTIISVEGMTFGHLEFVPIDGSLPADRTFQVFVSTLREGSYFEAAKDSSNAVVVGQAFGDANRIFNVPPEAMAVKRLKVVLDSANTASKFKIRLTSLTNN